MRRKNRKFNNAKSRLVSWEGLGKVSCLLLLLLTFLTVNPVSGSAVFAEGNNSDIISNDVNSDGSTNSGHSRTDDSYARNAVDFDASDTADNEANAGLMALAGIATSSVGISFSPAKYYASLAPTTAGAPARIDLTATVNVYNSGGYTVYLRSDSPNLVGARSDSNVILGADTAKTYADMDVNTWGYASREGLTVLDTDTYKAVAVSALGDQLAANNPEGDINIDHDTKTIALSFAAKVNTEVSPDTYSNTMTLSVVSSPMKVVEIAYDYNGITNLQQMTTAICESAPIGGIKQLKDTRDSKYYWIGKLGDGHCWMTQNLDLDLSTGTTLAPITSDVTTNWKPAYSTASTVSSSTILEDDTGQRSWSLGDYRIAGPTVADDCGTGSASIKACEGINYSRFTPYGTPTSANTADAANAHYIVGNYYQWCAATAGCSDGTNTGASLTGGQASSSICPKGWRLPTADDASIGSFQSLIDTSPIGFSVDKLTSAPYYFVRGGYVDQYIDYLLSYIGNFGYYWSSTPYANDTQAYLLAFGGFSVIDPLYGYSGNRRGGFSVRCIAR